MECAECTVRSAVGYCHECEILLCEVCSHSCERCGKVVCRSHIQRTSSGRNICVSCVVMHYDKRARQSKERRERRAEQAVAGEKVRKSARKPRKRPVENLSFEALAGDVESVGAVEPVEPVRTSERRPSSYQDASMVDTEALNARVLTGSASNRAPAWISGLALGVFAWLICIAALNSTVGLQQNILAFVALVLAGGTVAWTATGALTKTPDVNRTRARITFGIGAGALLTSAVLLIVHAR